MEWDVRSVDCWSQGLGMASSPLFGRNPAQNGTHTVFLDGHASSFALSLSDDESLVHEAAPLSWTWSANLRHLLVLNSTKDLFLRQWSTPSDLQRLRIPRSVSEAEQLVEKLGAFRRPREASVVGKMIATFKSLRATLFSYQHADNLDVMRVFNAMIRIAEHGMAELEKCSTIGDLASLDSILTDSERTSIYQKANIDDIIYAFVNSAPSGLSSWDANLLLRHASGELYQEAHFELERQEATQRSLFGEFEPNRTRRGTQQRDARLTPPELARTLAEQALDKLHDSSDGSILDPACGSGVFLQEALRTLQARGQRGRVKLVAFDRSAVSVEITQFCMQHAIEDARQNGIEVEFKIRMVDALSIDWENPAVVLMNPPFASYKDMNDEDRLSCKGVLGQLAVGQYDKSMAFVWKAIESVQPDGVVASVIPSTLLDSNQGAHWRAKLLERADLRCIGRFGGYSYFPGAMVAPAFIVLEAPSSPDHKELTVVAAEEGHEELAMRALRRREPKSAPQDGIFVSFDRERVTAATWMPKTYRYAALLDALSVAVPTVEKMFDVNQGALTGDNKVFVLTEKELEELPKKEHRYFRPAASTNTIRRGKLLVREYVFYPYGHLLINSEKELQDRVPEYYKILNRNKLDLMDRRDKTTLWWTLTEPRSWQVDAKPKILSAYFGASGNFAYDEAGDFVCLHGYAWNKIDDDVIDNDPTDGEPSRRAESSFYDTNLPYAYTALLNSKPFELLLSCFCTRVAGGQFNLSKRYVRHIPLPDLANAVPGDIVHDLAEVGQNLGDSPIDHSRLSVLAAAAYGVPLMDWGLERVGVERC